jgi:hypothetical protein
MRFYPKVTKDKWLVYGGACLAILLLATNHRYVFNSFYVNGHLLLSSQILVIVACGWLLNTNGLKSSQTMLIQLQTLVIPAAIITRPEATLVILLVLLPTLLLDKLSWKLRAIPLVVAGLSTILWQSFIAVQYIARGQQVPVEVIGFLLVASVAIVSIKLLNIRWLKNRARQILISIELGLWAVFAAFSIASPSIASRSLRSIYHNVVLGEGLWGLSLVVLGYFALVLMLLTRDKSLISLRFPITAFLPLMLIIAYLIDGAYRVGAGDSFNRMLLHILPLLVLYIVVATISLLLIHQPGERKRQSS